MVGVAASLFSRLLFAYSWGFIVALLSLSRWVQRAITAYQRRRGYGVDRVLIVGVGRVGRAIIQALVARPELGYHVVGFVDDDPAKQDDLGRVRCFGPTANLPGIVEREGIDEVIITLPWMSHRKVMDIMAQCERSQVRFRIVPDLFQLSLDRVDVDEINGVPLIGIREVSIRGSGRLLKRAIDVIGSFVGLVVLSPLFLVVALLIKVESPGPVLFRQIRVGQGGRPFTVYKFRSMYVGAESLHEELQRVTNHRITFKLRDDPRCTRVGRFLRRLSIDELPQLYNVLRGEMSLVGPRPPLPSEVEKYEDWHKKRLEVAPGITGLWQVRGRADLPFEEMVMLDIYYIENWSLGLDLRILLETIPTVVSGRGAY
jgi:exopolysaccharide biosynthesis polyprenyl glycosylphosphotransferase